jgi:hypothetical protein
MSGTEVRRLFSADGRRLSSFESASSIHWKFLLGWNLSKLQDCSDSMESVGGVIGDMLWNAREESR